MDGDSVYNITGVACFICVSEAGAERKALEKVSFLGRGCGLLPLLLLPLVFLFGRRIGGIWISRTGGPIGITGLTPVYSFFALYHRDGSR